MSVLEQMHWGLIVIIGVEVSEVCIGVGLPGELRVEVLISFLQNQIVFVEGLRRGERKGVNLLVTFKKHDCCSQVQGKIKSNKPSQKKEEKKKNKEKEKQLKFMGGWGGSGFGEGCAQ